MNRHYILAVFLLLLCSRQSIAQSSDKKFGRQEILEDLTYLTNSLQDAHYNLYAYTSEEDFSEHYNKVRESITQDSVTLLQATTLFQKVTAAVNNGHTEIDFPGASYRTYAYNGGTLFPLELAFEDNKSLVRKNFSDIPAIPVGATLVSINGMPMSDILARLYPQVSAERTYLKNAKIEMISFPRLYWQVFGQHDRFQVKIRFNGTVQEHSLQAVDLIEGYEMKRNEVLNAAMDVKFYDEAAYLNPGNFSGDEQKYQRFIDSAFAAIKQRNSKNLIIDLRNNGGGNNAFSDYLVSYVATKPFTWNSAFTMKTSRFLKEHTRRHNDTTDPYFRKILTHPDGTIYPYEFEEYLPQPEHKRYDGTVYVLVNRQSHSQSAVTAAQFQDYKLATIVGEETGDYPTLYASQFQYTLPHTGIAVKVSKGRIIRVNGSEKQEGVLPDIVIKDHLVDDEDEILQGLLQTLK